MKLNFQNRKRLENFVESINNITSLLPSKGKREKLIKELKELKQIAIDLVKKEEIPDKIVKVKSMEDIATTQADKLDFERLKLENKFKEEDSFFKNPSFDNVNHPKHYTTDNPTITINCPAEGGKITLSIECIDVIRNMPSWKGCAIKYLWRAGLKSDASLSDKEKEIEDLRKAVWYINDRIEKLNT